MKKVLSFALVLCMLLAAMPAMAEESVTISLDGLVYTIENAEATVKADKTGKADLPERVVIPSEVDGYTVKHVGYMAFKDCDSVKEFVLPETIETIEPHAFEDCDALTSITIPGSVKYIYGFAFLSCDSLQKVTLNEGVEFLTASLGGCFAGCESLKEISLPESLLYIGYGTFSDCKSLEEVHIPEKVYRIDNAFDGCTSLKKVTIHYKNPHFTMDDAGIIYDKDKTSFMKGLPYLKGVVTIPATMTKIPQGALNGTGVEQVIIHDNVTEIEGGAFAGCSELRRITIPDKVTVINSLTFRGSKKLEEVVLGESVKYLGHSAFGDCKIDSLVIKGNELSLYEQEEYYDSYKGTATEWRASIEDTTIGTIYAPVGSDGEKYANEKGIAFMDIQGYEYTPEDPVANFIIEEAEDTVIIKGYKDPTTTEIYVPAVINGKRVVLGEGAFQWTINPDNRALEKITIAEGITSLPKECFYFAAVKEVILPESLTEIGERAFSNCSSLTELDIKNVKTIGCGAFSGCEKLETLTHSGKLEAIGEDAFNLCLDLKAIDLSTVKTLGVRAFFRCDRLTEVNLQSLETWDGVDDSIADENGRCYGKQVPHTHGGQSYYIGLNAHVYAPFMNCRGLEEVIVRYPDNKTGESFPALFLSCQNIKTFTIENYQDSICRWEASVIVFDNTDGYILLGDMPWGMTIRSSDEEAEEYAEKLGVGFVLAGDDSTEVEPTMQSIHGGIVLRYNFADRITKIAESLGGTGIVSGDNIAVQKDGRSMAVAGDVVYYAEGGVLVTESLYEDGSFIKMPERALESIFGTDSRKSAAYKEAINRYNGQIYRLAGTIETPYGSVAEICTGGVMHGFANVLHFVKWDGGVISLTKDAPYGTAWSKARWDTIKLSGDGKILTITYPENKKKSVFAISADGEGRVLWEEGTYVITANLETGEVKRVIKPLKEEKAEEAPAEEKEEPAKTIEKDGMKISVSILSEPENGPVNMFDDNFISYCVLYVKDEEKPEYMEFDLGEVKDVEQIALAFREATSRTTYFDVRVSRDGINYETVIEKRGSNADTDSLQYFDINKDARYIRVYGYSNTFNKKWVSITEARVIAN